MRGLVEHLVRDPVAHPRGERLVEEKGLHDAAARPQQLRETCRRRHREQRVEAEPGDRRLVLGIVTQPGASQPPRVGHRQLPAVVEAQPQLQEARRPDRPVLARAGPELDRRRARRLQGTGHPEVEQRMRGLVELRARAACPSAGPPPRACPRSARLQRPCPTASNTSGSSRHQTRSIRRPTATASASRRARSTSGSSGTLAASRIALRRRGSHGASRTAVPASGSRALRRRGRSGAHRRSPACGRRAAS